LILQEWRKISEISICRISLFSISTFFCLVFYLHCYIYILLFYRLIRKSKQAMNEMIYDTQIIDVQIVISIFKSLQREIYEKFYFLTS